MNDLTRSAHLDEALHWQLELLQTLDVGLVVLDRQYRVHLWNSFMSNHSGLPADHLLGHSLFERVQDLPEVWLRRKLDTVFLLRTRAFITWEERPCLFRFKSYRPITGLATQMYQNVSLIPLTDADGNVNHLGLLIYDMTDAAMSRKGLEAANHKLAELSRTDRLTGLSNRGHWEESLQQEYQRFIRTQQISSLLMLDIDHFKSINDTHGHLAGDEVLRQLALTLTRMIRTTDHAGRYGGEEFGILLVNTASDQAAILAERLREAVSERVIRVHNQRIPVTISVGIAEISNEQMSHEGWLREADTALYRSKTEGRNRVTLSR